MKIQQTFLEFKIFSKKIDRFFALILIIIQISGCAVGPDYEPPCIEMPEKYKEAPKGWKIANPCDCIPTKWWEVFNDQDLNNLEEELNCCNFSVKVALAQYQEARAQVAEAYASFYPTLSFLASAMRERLSGNRGFAGISTSAGNFGTTTTKTTESPPFNDFLTQFTATWEPDIWGSVYRNVEANVANAQAYAALLANVRLSMQGSLAQYYFQLRNLDADQTLLDETVAAYRRDLQLVQNQFKSGTANELAVLQAKAQLRTAETAALDNGINRAQYEHAIAVLLGRPPAAFCLARGKLKRNVPKIPVEVPSVVLERRPDVAAAERQMAQANALIGVAIAAFYPTITLTGTFGYESNQLRNLFSGPSQLWSYGAQLSEMILDGGLRKAQVEFAYATYAQNVANYRQTVLTAFQNVEDNLVALRILKAERARQNEIVAENEKILRLTLTQFRVGTVNYTDVITAQNNLYAAKKNANDIQGRLLVAAVGLLKALGGSWDLCTDKCMSIDAQVE